MQADPMGEAPQDLSHAGSVVDKAIQYMMEQRIGPLSAASALLGGAIGLLSRQMSDEAIVQVLQNAIASVQAGELREGDGLQG
ncbi:hypothetical protein FK498_13135 [Elioraea sp. Yellowstone]|jgi:hypothetical protein|uniref:hypothetical protein n=1 Tax=Elioraea sp. Yellowstone TaxID=2592070 RepID=UPI001153858B|nr:hypothetical protein [Elioraea sp. Yellowstone]TQF77336.1 hypothetical protein FK498_13135 [Elioraea sp. Yellowstone]